MASGIETIIHRQYQQTTPEQPDRRVSAKQPLNAI